MVKVVRQKRVGILVTGQTEYYGMEEALKKLFPDHSFDCLPAEKKSLPDTPPYSGFTSCQLSREHVRNPPEACLHLVARAAQETVGDRRKDAYDLVIILDDLEICNAHQPDLVSEVMRTAVRMHLDTLDGTIHARTKQALRNKVSFHLAAPMIEAWFFIDEGALQRAGVHLLESVSFIKDSDPESFLTDDQSFLSADATFCTALANQSHSRRRKNKPKWIDNANRHLHPKAYLQWLTRNPENKCCTNYQESRHGAEALRDLDWAQVPSLRKDHFGFLKAMIEDLEQGLETKAGVNMGPPSEGISTAIAQGASEPMLRNI